MTNEEKIEFKIQMVERHLMKDNSPYVTEGLVLLMKFLKIKPRTIDTLEKGDIFRGKCKIGHATVTLKGLVISYDKDSHMIFLDKNYEVLEVFSNTVPKEWINLWGGSE